MSGVSTVAPSHWAHRFVGLPYILGAGECAHRAALVWRQVFGWEVEVPAAHGNLRLGQRMIRAALASGRWARVEAPREGDGVAMWKGDLVCHVGVWVEGGPGGGSVLHCTRAEGTVLTPVEELEAQGFRVFGCFRWVGEGARAAA